MKKFYLFLLCVLACSCTKENIEDTLPVNISFKYNIESGSMYNTRSISNIISQLPVETQYYLRLESSKCRYLFNVDFNRDPVICNLISATLFPKDSKYEKTSINIDNIELGKYYILHPNKSNYGNGFGLTVEDFIEGTL